MRNHPDVDLLQIHPQSPECVRLQHGDVPSTAHTAGGGHKARGELPFSSPASDTGLNGEENVAGLRWVIATTQAALMLFVS